MYLRLATSLGGTQEYWATNLRLTNRYKSYENGLFMKKRLVALLVLLLLSVSLGNASAVRPASVDEKLQAKREEIQARKVEQQEQRVLKREEIMARIETKKATAAAKLQEKRQERIMAYYGNLSKRITATIARIEKLIERIETRLASIEEDSGVDVTFIESQLADAKELLDQASASLLAANDTLEVVLESEDPKEAFALTRETVKEIKNNLKEVHQILVHVIGDIKGLRVGTNGTQVTPTGVEPTAVEPTTVEPTATVVPTITTVPTATAVPTVTE